MGLQGWALILMMCSTALINFFLDRFLYFIILILTSTTNVTSCVPKHSGCPLIVIVLEVPQSWAEGSTTFLEIVKVVPSPTLSGHPFLTPDQIRFVIGPVLLMMRLSARVHISKGSEAIALLGSHHFHAGGSLICERHLVLVLLLDCRLLVQLVGRGNRFWVMGGITNDDPWSFNGIITILFEVLLLHSLLSFVHLI